MSDILQLSRNAELAFASYAKLRPSDTALPTNIDALAGPTGIGMSPTQATEFAKSFPTVVASYNDLPGTGFQATVFKDTAGTGTPGNLTLAIRGTEYSGGDFVPTDTDILAGGAAYDQIVAMVNWWNRASAAPGAMVNQFQLVEVPNSQIPQGAVVLRAGANPDTSYVLAATEEQKAAFSVAEGNISAALAADPDHRVEVVGHSTGGHLAMAFSTIFASTAAGTTVFNAPGFTDSETNQLFFQKLGGAIPAEGAANITNVIADESLSVQTPFSPIAGLHSRPGLPVNIAIENQWNSDEPAPFLPALNHSIVDLTDSLAVFNLLGDLDPAFSVTNAASEAKYKTILNLAAQGTAASYERIVDALRALLNIGHDLLPVGNGQRERLYQAIYGDPTNKIVGLVPKISELQLAGQVQIKLLPPDATMLFASASEEGLNGLAYRYALKNLNPFVVQGEATGPLYAQQNENGELDLYDAASGTGTLTQQWLQDRTDFLERKLYINGLDTDKYYQVPSTDPENPLQPPDAQGVAYQQQARLYIDLASGYVASSGPNPDALQNHIFGTDAADVVYAPVSGREDWLYGGGGDDVLAGYYANDYLEGGTGLDTYQFFSGDAADTVLDVDGEGILVRNGAALALGVKVSADVWQLGGTTYTRNGTDLKITFQDTATDSITVRDFDFAAAQAGSYLGIRLADAISLPNGALLLGDKTLVDTDSQAADVQIGYDLWGNELTQDPAVARDDALYGSDAASEHIEGREGNDIIFGDTVQLAAPGPRANPVSSAVGAADFIEGGAGRDIVTAGAGNDWVEGGTDGDILRGNAGNDTLYADTSNGQTLTVGDAINQGNMQGAAPGLQDLLTGDAGDDLLISSTGADYLAGGEGRDVVVGGAGDDTIYGDRSVTNAPLDWSITRTVDVQNNVASYIVTTSSGFSTTEGAGAGDVIYAGAGNDWVFAGGGDDFVDTGSGLDVVLGEAGNDTIFGGADRDILDGDSADANANGSYGDDYVDGGGGNDILFGGKGNDILIGGQGEDQLQGGDGDDVLYGGTETDVLQGGSGKDTYVYLRGDGYDIVNDPDIAKDSPYLSMVVLGPGITKADVKFRLGSLVIDLGGGDALEFLGFSVEDPLSTPMLEGIQFADGGLMTFEDILAQGFDIDGTEGDDALFGTPYTDRIDAKGGDDTVTGRAGDDTILGGAGDDWIEADDGNDVVDGGEGSDQIAGGWGDDTLQGGDGNDAIAGEGGNDALDGGADNDSFVGGIGDDTLNGGTGDDLLIGNEGSDTYTFTAGDGNDLIDEQALIALGIADEAGVDVVRFDATVTQAQVTLSRGGNGDLTIRYGATDAITVVGQYTGAAQAIERIEFDDGSFIDKAALNALPIAPIEGTAGDDTLSGTPGNDTIAGGAGADSYAMYLGMGRDTLIDDSPSGETGTLALAEGLSLNALKARQVGDDLAVDIRGTSEGVIIQGYFAPGAAQDWQIAEYGGAVTTMQDLIDRPDPYADDVALGAREDFRQALLSDWATETVSPVLPTYAYVFDAWTQTTFHYLGGVDIGGVVLQPYTEVLPRVITFFVNGYGIRDGASFVGAPLVHHSIDVLATSQSSDDAVITAQSQSQSSSQNLSYGVTAGKVIPGYGYQSESSTGTFPTGYNSFNVIESHSAQGWAPITLTPGGGAGYAATLNIQEIAEIRTVEDITGGASDNVIYGAAGVSAGHVALIDAGEGDDTVYAGPDDYAYGNEGDDTIYGGALVYGGNGADTLDGGAVQYGGAGDDTLTGGTFMAGGSGDDAMTGVEGATTFYIDPSEVGADVVQDVAGIGIEDLESWYYESIGVEGASEGDAGLWAVVGPSLDSLDSLYWDQQAYPGYESQAKAALKSNGEELAAFFYLTLDDLRADLAVVGAPYRPEDVRYLLPFETLTAHDYQALGRFYDAGLIDTDSVTFGAGVAPADLTLNWNYVDVLDPLSGQPVPHAALEVSWGAASSVSVAIPRSRDLIGTGAEQFRFADGTVLSMADMIALAPPLPSLDPAIPVNGTAADDLMLGSDDSERFDGLSGDDTIIARGGDDVLVGGDGADSLSGGPGADRYVYEAAEIGIDHIDDTGTSGEAYLDSYYQARGLENWKLRPEYTQGGRYRIYVSIQYGYQYFDTFEDAADAAASMIDPPPVHFVEPATVVAPLVFRDDPAALQELIAAGVLDRDVVTFGEGLSLQDLAITVTVFGPDADLHPEEPWYGGGTLSVRWNDGLAGFDVDVPDASYGFTGTSLASRQWEDYRLGEGIEAFEFSDGSTYGLEEILQRANLFLRYGYLFERGSDPQVIEGEWTGVDFAPNIVPTDLYTYRNGADLAFGVIADSAFATIPDWYADPAAVPQWEFRFADGTVYDTDTVTRLGLTQFGSEFGDSLVADPDFASALYGLEGSDVLFGGGGNDLLNGGPGYDYLYGQGGNDIYVFGADSDVDVVSERLLDGGQNGTDSVRFAADVDTTDVVADRDYDSLILNVASTGAQLLLDGWFSELGGLIENFEFADGTVWHAADVEALLPAQVATAGDDFLLGLSGDDVLDGLEGDDTIYGFGGNDTLRGGPGYDYLGGFAGDDTYEFGLGDGVDEIWDRSGTNVLRFDAGIDPESVMVTRDNDDYLYLIVGQGGDRVAIQSWFFAPQPQIAQVIFADGTTWSPAELESRITLVPATEFDDILWGTEGADVLNGLAGDDLIYGNGGNDVLLGGDGFDEIEGGDGDDILDGGQGDDEVDDWTGGHNLLQGGEGDDVLDHAAGRALLIGGLGDDEIDLDAGSSVVAYNPGDGMDTIYAFEQFTLSIGAGVTPSDLSLSPDGDDVIIKVAGVDSIRLTRDGGDTWPLVLLQLFGSVDIYNLTSTISTFENALAADPGLTEFQLGDALPNDLILSSDTGAVGGALAYRYAMTGSLAGLTNSQIFSVLQDSNFGTNLQDIIVVGGDSAPILDIPLADQSANEDAAFSFAVPATTFSDPDADELTYAATLDDGSALPAWLTFDAPTQTFSGIPLQADVGAIDLKVTATDPGGLSAEDSFTVTIANVNDAPVVSATDGELLLGDSAAAVTLFSVFDEDGQTPTQYELYDDVEGGGYFSVNGMQKAAGIAIPVSATDLADTDYVAGATPGTERVWARAYDGEAWSAWQSWTMTSALHIPDAAPDAMPAAATQTVLLDESVAASSLFSVTDADGDPVARYEFWDSTAGNGHFAINGVEQGVNATIAVDAADLSNATFVGGSEAGEDTVWVRATDGQTFGAWESWTMNSWPHETNSAPVADAVDGAVLRDQAVLAESLFTVTDSNGDGVVQYEFWDDTPGGGYFSLSGVAQTNNPIPVAAADLANLEYVGGSEAGVEQVWVRASDGLEWGAWKSWNMTTALHIPNSAPEVEPTAASQTVLLDQAVDASTLFSVSDLDADTVASFEFFDSTPGNGHFTVNGVEQGANLSISVLAADLADVQFVGSGEAGSDTAWVRATDGQSFGAWKSWTMNSWPHATNALPVVDAADATVLTGETVTASLLFSFTDADGDTAARYELFDDVAGGGYWRVNGVQQAAGAAIAVDAADLANTEYVGGANPGTEQVWARVNDGQEWGAWKSWTMASVLHEPNAAPEVTASTSTVLLDQSVSASSLFSVSDADNDTITQYELWDGTAGSGHFTVGGVEQGVNVAIGVTAAQLDDTQFVGGSAAGTDTVWARANDGMAWSDWKSWTMNSWPHQTNDAPVVSASNAGILKNESLSASMFFGVSDSDGDAATKYEFWDDVNGGGYWALGGVQQASGAAIAVGAEQLPDLTYVGGANPGTEQVWVRANDGMDWSAWKNWLMSTEGGMLRGGAGPDTLNGEAGPTVLEGGAGNDTLTDTDGNNLFSGGAGDDTMTGGDGNDLFAGGTGNDTINTGAGNNVIAHNAGEGTDTVYAAAGASNTLSFGGGIGYDDLSLSKNGNDLVVSAGANDQVVIKDWYTGSKNVLNLQVVLDATQAFDANSSDPLYNKKVQTFDFLGMVSAFDQALVESPGLTSWAVTNALLEFHLSGSDDAALGGDLAYLYGKNDGFTGISLQAAQAAIGAPGFGADAQTLHPFNGLQEGYVKLS